MIRARYRTCLRRGSRIYTKSASASSCTKRCANPLNLLHAMIQGEKIASPWSQSFRWRSPCVSSSNHMRMPGRHAQGNSSSAGFVMALHRQAAVGAAEGRHQVRGRRGGETRGDSRVSGSAPHRSGRQHSAGDSGGAGRERIEKRQPGSSGGDGRRFSGDLKQVQSARWHAASAL